jgi:cell division protein FtsQ
MSGGGRTEPGSRRRARAASAVVPLSRTSADDRLDLARLVPSGRSLLVTFALVAVVFAGYWGARTTSVFAVETVDVRGAPPEVARDVRRATRGLMGTSLLALDATAVEGKVRSLPSVAAASVDRAFPHTLVVRVAPVWPVAVARRGDGAWLVSGSNRVIGAVDLRAEPSLPRLWLPRKVSVEVGRTLPATYEPATRVLAGLREVQMPARVKAVRATQGELTVVLHRGLEILLGDTSDLLVKLTVAARVVPLVDESMLYLDVSVPERPVASAYLNSQVESETSTQAHP